MKIGVRSSERTLVTFVFHILAVAGVCRYGAERSTDVVCVSKEGAELTHGRVKHESEGRVFADAGANHIGNIQSC